jgi:hypothetical protein
MVSTSGKRTPMGVWILVAVLVSEPSRADELTAKPGASVTEADRSAALALVREGNRLLDRGDPTAALERFEQARSRVGGDKLRFNIGQALAAIPGRERAAFQEFSLFVTLVPNALPTLIQAAQKELDRLRMHLGFLRVDATPVGAALYVDNESVGTTPLETSVVVAPGQHALVVSAAGYKSFRTSINAVAGQEHTETVVLASAPIQPRANAGDRLRPTNAASGVLSVTRSSAIPTMEASPSLLLTNAQSSDGSQQERRSGPIYRRWWFWAGASAIVLGTASIIALSYPGGVTHSCPAEIPQSRCFPFP